jgi:hypothetical protein
VKSVSVPPWAALLVAVSAWACDDPLKKTELVEEPRVLAARIEVEGEPERAAPFPGESATVQFLVAAPELEPALGFSLVACRSAPSNIGVPACHSAPFAESERLEPEPGAPALSFELPEPDAGSPKGRLLVKGVICPNGAPRVSDDPGRCASGEHALPVVLEAELASAEDANLNPSFATANVTFDAESLPEAELSGDCAGSGLLEVPAKSNHRLRFEFPESARDRVPKENAYDPDRESLLVSHFSSGGELGRAFSPIPYDRAEISTEVEWTAPDSDASAGLLVRFWFVVRDLRGGSDFIERAVCVVP